MNNIIKCYELAGKPVAILKGITIHIGTGEFVSIMGPSGSGKSTLSAILGCLSNPSSGEYLLGGQVVSTMRANELAKLRNQQIGFIFQDFNLLDGLVAWENVALPLVYAGIGSRERKRRALESLNKVGLGAKANNRPNQLSGGQKQRVAIARALVTQPSLVFADEPTGALDKRTGDEIMGLLQELNFAGQTIVQVTHSAEHALYSKRILHLVDGLIVKDEVVGRPVLARIYSAGETKDNGALATRLWRIIQKVVQVDPAAMADLEQLYQLDQTAETLIEAARALVRFGITETDALVEQIFQIDQPTIRAELLRSAESRGPQYLLPYLWRALDDKNAWIRYLAISSLKRHLSTITPEEKERIAGLIGDSDERVRATIVVIIGGWKDKSYIPKLLKTTTDLDGRVRANTIESLARYRDDGIPEVVTALKAAMTDKNSRTRANASLTCHPLDSQHSLDALFEMLHSENNIYRASAAWALGELPEDHIGPLLLERLKVEHNDLVIGQLVGSLAKHAGKKFPLSTQLKTCLETQAASQEAVQAA